MNPSSLVLRCFPPLAAVLALGLSAAAGAAGVATVKLPATGAGPELAAMVWTPCAKPAEAVPLGSFTLQGVRDCAPSGQGLPLVVISHGKGGSLIGHHDTAAALADAGFVVASLSHPGDSYGDDGRSGELGIFESRPADMSRLISYMTETWPQRGILEPQSVGVFGFSRGGFTALSLAGAVPSVAASAERFCAAWWSFAISLCRQLKDEAVQLRPQADPRVRAAVVVDPLNLFDVAGIGAVRVPVQLWASELGGDAVELAHVEAIQAALPQAPEYEIAKGAGHFAYLAPCPPALMASAKEICVDPEGFDRVAWHSRFNARVVSFFQKTLSPAAKNASG